MSLNLNTSAISGVVKRFGIVVYVLILLLTALIAYASNYASFANGLFTVGASLLIALLVLEITRITILFIFTGQNALKGKVPLATKIFGVIAIGILLISGTTYYGYEIPAQKQEDAAALAKYQKALADLPGLQARADTCYSAAQTRIESQPPVESAYCRSVRLDYNACREYGSPTMCLSTWDYVSACATNNSLLLSAAKRTCQQEVIDLADTINRYQLSHPEVVHFRPYNQINN